VDQLSLTDVLQKSFIAMSMGSTDRITALNVVSNIMMSFLVGLFIYYIYKKAFQGVLYQRSFNISLIIASTVTSLVIMTISGNLILSLGMVGALSIVRFRTPVKDSMDLVFLFWAISVGIANGVGYYNISVVGSVMIAIFLLLLTRVRDHANAYLLVAQIDAEDSQNALLEQLKELSDKVSVKSITSSKESTEITVELNLKNDDAGFVTDLTKSGIVKYATLVSYEQDLSTV